MCFTENYKQIYHRDEFHICENKGDGFDSINRIGRAVNLPCNIKKDLCGNNCCVRTDYRVAEEEYIRDLFTSPLNCLYRPPLCCNRKCPCRCGNCRCGNKNYCNNDAFCYETLIPFSTASSATVTTHLSGISHLGTSLAFPGNKEVDVTNGLIAPPQELPYTFSVTHSGIIKSIEGSFNSENPIYLPAYTQTFPYLILAISHKGENQFHIIAESKAFSSAPLIGGTTYPAYLIREIERKNINYRVYAGDKIALIGAIEVLHSDTPISLELNFEAGVTIKL